MDTKNYICSCLGIYGSCEHLDDIQDSFNIELNESDIDEALQISPKDLSNGIVSILFDKVKYKAVEELGLNEESFDYFINGSLDTHLYYNNQEIYDWEDLEEIKNKKEE